jgi:hypothetical protein
MELGGVQYILHGSRTDVFKLWAVGDLHLGNAACNKELIKRDLDAIEKDPYSFWIGLGDYADYISAGDKRFDPTTISPELSIADMGRLGRRLGEQVRDAFGPIKHKCLGLLFGNHEKSYFVGKEQEDLHSWMCTELDVKNLGYCAFLDVAFVRGPEYVTPSLSRERPFEGKGSGYQLKKRVFVHHGCGHSATPGGKLNKLLQFMSAFPTADITAVAHVHDQTVKRMDALGANDDCTRLKVHKRIGLITGGYLEAYAVGITSYAERAGFFPTVMGSVYVSIDPEKNEMRASI